MRQLILIPGKSWVNSGVTVLARLLAHDGAAAQQADFTSITFFAYDMSSATPGTELNAGGTVLTVADVIFDSLVTGNARWVDDQGDQIDDTGYNFAHPITPGSGILTAPHTFLFKYVCDMAVGADIIAAGKVKAHAVEPA